MTPGTCVRWVIYLCPPKDPEDITLPVVLVVVMPLPFPKLRLLVEEVLTERFTLLAGARKTVLLRLLLTLMLVIFTLLVRLTLLLLRLPNVRLVTVLRLGVLTGCTLVRTIRCDGLLHVRLV